MLDNHFAKTEKIFEELKYLKNNIIINEQLNFRGKCGEIFLENGKYLITCYFCTTNAISIDILIEHIYQEHLKLNRPEYLEPLYEEICNRAPCILDTTISNNKIKQEPQLKTYNNDILSIDTKTRHLQEVPEENNNILLDIPKLPIKILNKFQQYSCSFCTNSYNHYNELEDHFLQHTVMEKNKSFQNNNNNTDKILHVDQILPARIEEDKYCCKLCERQYGLEKSYRAHFKKTHTEYLSQHYFKTFKCPDCTSSFQTRDRYDTHRRWHNREKPHKCEYCPRVFLLKANLTSHIHTHLGIKPYCCRFCGRRFNQQNSQKAHERNIHTKERPYQCEQCGKSFPRSTLLREHLKRHTNTRPFKCHICFKDFFNNHYLQAHINRHTGNKTYDCNLCPKKFRDNNTLKAHKKLHLNVKEYKCKLCNREFAQKPGLYGHMKVYHKSITTGIDLLEF